MPHIKETEQMTRLELFRELAGYAHPTWYQLSFGYTTEVLAAIVGYFRSGRRIVA